VYIPLRIDVSGSGLVLKEAIDFSLIQYKYEYNEYNSMFQNNKILSYKRFVALSQITPVSCSVRG
jgi:hypothetical protein